eukprot:TRINITY_DN1486_c0_g2_i2.p1 TRINITY_DN1486_c0_g2~~TRINITY_DN1486_c0_g2_i2.p1  ORF type:complete len:210 (-),score=36.01 TRINITY_DN1486_c0_g2_i2:186-815(-)
MYKSRTFQHLISNREEKMNAAAICFLVMLSACALPFATEGCICLPYNRVPTIHRSLNCFDGALIRFVVLHSRLTGFNKNPTYIYKSALQEVFYDTSLARLEERVGQTNVSVLVEQQGNDCDYQLEIGSSYIAKVKVNGNLLLVTSQCEKVEVLLSTESVALASALADAEFTCDPCFNNPCEAGETCVAQQVNCFRAPCWPVAHCDKARL